MGAILFSEENSIIILVHNKLKIGNIIDMI